VSRVSNWDERLEAIMNAHGLPAAEFSLTQSDHKIRNYWSGISGHGRIALWGALYAEEFLAKIPDYSAIACIVDSNPAYSGKSISGIPIRTAQDVQKHDFDAALILSFASGKEIAAYIEQAFPAVTVIDLHRELDLRFAFFSPLHHYHDIYMQRQSFRSLDLGTKAWKDAAAGLIGKYVAIRDFAHAFQIIEMWKAQLPEDCGEINGLHAELLDLISDLTLALANRSAPSDTTMILIDSLREKDVYRGGNLPFLQDFAKKSFSFRQAFSASTHTNGCLLSMFQGGLPIDDRYDITKYIDYNHSPLLQYLDKQGIEFVSNSGSIKFSDNSLQAGNKKRVVTEQPKFYGITSLYFWNLAVKLTQSAGPVFSLLHVLEAHVPFIGGNQTLWIEEDGIKMVMDYFRDPGRFPLEDILQQRSECLRYVDRQLAFYMPLFQSMNWIVFGDHGMTLGDQDVFGHLLTWHDDMIHVPLLLSLRHIQPGENHELFSMRRFGDLLISLMSGSTPPPPPDFIEVQREPIYNTVFRSDASFMRGAGKKYLRGFKLVRTETEKYILYDDGREEMYLLPDETQDVSSSAMYRERLAALRNLIEDHSFPYAQTEEGKRQ